MTEKLVSIYNKIIAITPRSTQTQSDSVGFMWQKVRVWDTHFF